MKEMQGLMHLIKREISYKINAEVTGVQGMVIGFLNYKNELGEDVFQKDIEEEFTIRRSTVTNLLINMEKNDLISREAVPFDARLKKVLLTNKAIKIHENFEKALSDTEEKIKQGITEEEINNFCLVINKMRNNLINE